MDFWLMLALFFLIPSLVAGVLVTGCITIAAQMVRRSETPPTRRPPGPVPAPRPKAPGGGALSLQHVQATLTYLAVVWAVGRLLTRVGGDLHAHPLPFVLFGLGLGLAQALPVWEAARPVRPTG